MWSVDNAKIEIFHILRLRFKKNLRFFFLNFAFTQCLLLFCGFSLYQFYNFDYGDYENRKSEGDKVCRQIEV